MPGAAAPVIGELEESLVETVLAAFPAPFPDLLSSAVPVPSPSGD
jgi:hypothetical protein